MRRRTLIAMVRLPSAIGLALLAALPILLTRIPPLTDVPGHIGRLSVQTAAAGDPLLRYFGFHWALTLNLASDLIVQLVHPVIGVIPTIWLLSAATPALTVIGIVAIARVTNRSGAWALPWSLLFVFNLPFLWGFLNFALALSVVLIAFAGWLALEDRRGWRALLFMAIVPPLFVGHGVAGAVLLVLIVGYRVGEGLASPERGRGRETLAALLPLWPPLLAAAVTLLVWKAVGAGGGGATLWLAQRKTGAIVHMLQDQSMAFDIASVIACVLIWVAGHRAGARLRGGAAGAVIALILLFIATPSQISGSDEIDLRLAPLIPMLAFAMQDWSAVHASRRRLVLALGLALLGARYVVTTVSFVRYDRRYAEELAALDRVRPGSRVFNLVGSTCDRWRSERLDHLGNLATTLRGAWVNAHWSIGGLHLLDVRYRPSPLFYDDPSQFIYPAACAWPRLKPYAHYRRRLTLGGAIRALPLTAADYLWLIDAKLPSDYRDRRLRRIWANEDSELYAIVR
ncbi:hypothetical protein ACU5AX_15820 [Sphingomonas sp. XXL09]|uniref:hypothetical protein n=1 Tax=Sphingomonas sp. XXL09 TaxID=3457787 RepID=UPI00406BB7AD